MGCILLGMLRQRKFEFVTTYREEAANAVKAIVKQVSELFHRGQGED